MTRSIGSFFAVSALALAAAGCGKGKDGADNKPLTAEESAKYRQVTVQVTGLT